MSAFEVIEGVGWGLQDPRSLKSRKSPDWHRKTFA